MSTDTTNDRAVYVLGGAQTDFARNWAREGLGIGDMMRNVPGEVAARFLGSAALAGAEWADARYLWPRAFSDLYEAYDQRYGSMDYAHLGEIARINYENAKRNPNAQTRNWTFEPGAFSADDALNPVIEGSVRRNDCG